MSVRRGCGGRRVRDSSALQVSRVCVFHAASAGTSAGCCRALSVQPLWDRMAKSLERRGLAHVGFTATGCLGSARPSPHGGLSGGDLVPAHDSRGYRRVAFQERQAPRSPHDPDAIVRTGFVQIRPETSTPASPPILAGARIVQTRKGFHPALDVMRSPSGV